MRLKRVWLIALCLLGLVMAGTACRGKKTTGTSDPHVDSVKTEELFVWVENARLRKEPDLNAEVITELKGGEKLIFSGEYSTVKTKVSLRGVEFEDVWSRVKTMDGKEGWIFKPMLTPDEGKAKAMNDFLMVPGKNVGPVKLLAAKKDVIQLLGSEFITEGEIYFPEEQAMPGFYVFKNSPFELQCVTGENNVVTMIVLRQPNSPWHTVEGVHVGTLLDDLVKLNQKPINFGGFGWDYGGNVTGYNKGQLSKFDNGLSIILGEPDNIEGLDDFMGDVDCSTRNRAILGKGAKVAEINVYDQSVL